eukprot:6205086-Pleurochrysis_carterae.AAC.6
MPSAPGSRESWYVANDSGTNPNAGPGSARRVRSVATKKREWAARPTAHPVRIPSTAKTAGSVPLAKVCMRFATCWKYLALLTLGSSTNCARSQPANSTLFVFFNGPSKSNSFGLALGGFDGGFSTLSSKDANDEFSCAA